MADLSVRSVSKSYGAVHAAREVSLEVQSGALVTLLGPSGSGKTTTLQIIAGFETPDAGDVLISGESVLRRPPHRRDIGIVFQSYALFPHMRIFDNVAFPLRMRRVDKGEIARRVAQALETVKLGGLAGRYPRQLSGGQQQRVALARALIFNPAILLMDEPLGALDKKLREHMQLEIRALKERLGITIVYVTHDQGEALTLSDRIVVMHEGRVAQTGTPSEIYEAPATEFVADFIGESNFLPGIVRERRSGVCVVDVGDGVLARGLPGAACAVGDRVKVAVRPERLHFGTGERLDTTLAGTVDEVIYLGEAIKYRIAGPGGVAVTVKQRAAEAAPGLGRGAAVEVGWTVQDARVLADETGAA